MEFKNFVFQAWKGMELIVGPLKLWKIKDLFHRLFTADDKARTLQDREE